MLELRKHMARWLLLWMLLLVAGQPLHIIVHHHQDQFDDQLAGTGIRKHSHPCLICAYVTDTVSCPQKSAEDVSASLIDDVAIPVMPMPVVGFSGNNISLRAPPLTG
jgi:hypothetical protein